VPVARGGLREMAAYAGGISGIGAAGLLSMAVWLLVVPLVDSATSAAPARLLHAGAEDGQSVRASR
jgi:hypothetical protein